MKACSKNPVAMIAKLESIHNTHKPGLRYGGYDRLFSIRLKPGEALPDLITRVGNAIAFVKDQRPTGFTLSDLEEELHSMTLIRALPAEYTSLKDSLMLLDDLNSSTVSEAFRNRSGSHWLL